MSKRVLFFLLLAVTILAPLTMAAAAESNKPGSGDHYELAVQGGLLLPGTISIWNDYIDAEVDTDTGFILKFYADMFAAPNFSVGLFLQIDSLAAKDIDADATMLEFGFSMKAKFPISSQLAFRPGIGIGYRNTDISTYNDKVDGMALNATFELQYAPTPGYFISFEGGFISQPVGGNADISMAWPPIFYFLAGIGF